VKIARPVSAQPYLRSHLPDGVTSSGTTRRHGPPRPSLAQRSP